MRVLVTGGFGYVGGRVCAALAAAGCDVVVGARRVPDDAPSPAPEVVRLDLADARRTEQAVAAARADAIVHLAALNEMDSLRDPRLAYAINCEGTYNVLAGAERAGTARFLYLSTFHVYGVPDGVITEDTPTAPSHPYATTHRAAEDIARYFARHRGVATASLRLSNAYGAPARPGIDRWTLAFNDFCRQAVRTGEIALATAGNQHRDFITLHDVGRAVVHALQSTDVIADGAAFNLGGRHSMSIRDGAELVARVAARELGRSVTMVVPEGPAGGRRVEYDISRLEATGFRLAGSMEDEIRATLAVCRAAADQGERASAGRG